MCIRTHLIDGERGLGQNQRGTSADSGVEIGSKTLKFSTELIYSIVRPIDRLLDRSSCTINCQHNDGVQITSAYL